MPSTPGDVELFWVGVEQGLIPLERGGKFDTFDRPVPGGHWALLSRSKKAGWYDAGYLPQLASSVDAIVNAAIPRSGSFRVAGWHRRAASLPTSGCSPPASVPE
jgi:hypothetical protein